MDAHNTNAIPGKALLIAEHLALSVNLLSPSANDECPLGSQPAFASIHVGRRPKSTDCLPGSMPVRAADAKKNGGTHHRHYTMNDTAHRLRAQKAYSTDPAYLERMAREEETRGVDPTNDATAEGRSALARREASTEVVQTARAQCPRIPVAACSTQASKAGSHRQPWAARSTNQRSGRGLRQRRREGRAMR